MNGKLQGLREILELSSPCAYLLGMGHAVPKQAAIQEISDVCTIVEGRVSWFKSVRISADSRWNLHFCQQLPVKNPIRTCLSSNNVGFMNLLQEGRIHISKEGVRKNLRNLSSCPVILGGYRKAGPFSWLNIISKQG